MPAGAQSDRFPPRDAGRLLRVSLQARRQPHRRSGWRRRLSQDGIRGRSATTSALPTRCSPPSWWTVSRRVTTCTCSSGRRRDGEGAPRSRSSIRPVVDETAAVPSRRAPQGRIAHGRAITGASARRPEGRQSIGHQCPMRPRSAEICQSPPASELHQAPCTSEQSALSGDRARIPRIALHTREVAGSKPAAPIF
jgi:hypothetical protein